MVFPGSVLPNNAQQGSSFHSVLRSLNPQTSASPMSKWTTSLSPSSCPCG